MTECAIRECTVQPDGRLSVQCVGVRRVHTTGDSEQDGYRVCVIDREIKDVPLAVADGAAAAPLPPQLQVRALAVYAAEQTSVARSTNFESPCTEGHTIPVGTCIAVRLGRHPAGNTLHTTRADTCAPHAQLLKANADRIIADITGKAESAPRPVRAAVLAHVAELGPAPEPAADPERLTWWAALMLGVREAEKLKARTAR